MVNGLRICVFILMLLAFATCISAVHNGRFDEKMAGETAGFFFFYLLAFVGHKYARAQSPLKPKRAKGD